MCPRQPVAVGEEVIRDDYEALAASYRNTFSSSGLTERKILEYRPTNLDSALGDNHTTVGAEDKCRESRIELVVAAMGTKAQVWS
jgi:hypothetical protein